MVDRRERVFFLIAAAIGFLYVALRAALVPLTHDEARTFQLYVTTGAFLPFGANWDAGNHLLSTALTCLSYRLLGPGPLALRIFSVLSYPMYAWYAWRLGGMVTHRGIRWCAWLALLFTPFMIDFFSLFRGYGIAMAFWMMALFHLVRHLDTGARGQLVLSLLGMLLASFADLSLLIQWCALLALFALSLLGWNRSEARVPVWIAWAVIGVCPLIFLARYAAELNARGLLYYGSDAGLIDGTLDSLLWMVVGLRPKWLVITAAVAVIALAWPAVTVLRVRPFTPRALALVVCVALVFAELGGRIILGQGFGMLYPIDRTAMHLVPLFLLALVLAIDRAAEQRRSWRWAALIFLWMPLRMAFTTNVDHTTYWPEQAIPAAVFDIVEERQQRSERRLIIGGYRQNPAVWTYGNFLRNNGLNDLDVTGFPQPSCDLMIIDPTFFDRPPGFRTLYAAPHGKLLLLERRDTLLLQPVFDSTGSFATTTDEFITLWEADPGYRWPGERFIDVQAVITSAADALEAVLVVEASDSAGNHLHYESVDLIQQRLRWKGDTLHVLRRLPAAAASAHRRVVYIWNVRRQELALDHVRLKLLGVVP